MNETTVLLLMLHFLLSLHVDGVRVTLELKIRFTYVTFAAAESRKVDPFLLLLLLRVKRKILMDITLNFQDPGLNTM